MRLTLRTMLAYLDETLEAADSQELGKKIAESEFATSLVARTHDTMRRIRLGAPKLDGRGIGLDPNTVAEYLDNTLPPERTPDFEKVCLESDVHLAEVASCHQVLTLVLGEPADVDPESRGRMYELGAKAETSAAGAPVTAASATPEVVEEHPAPSTRPKREVPDYLRESASSRGWLLTAASLLAAAALIGIFAVAYWPTVGPSLAVVTGDSPSSSNEREQAEPKAASAIPSEQDLEDAKMPRAGTEAVADNAKPESPMESSPVDDVPEAAAELQQPAGVDHADQATAAPAADTSAPEEPPVPVDMPLEGTAAEATPAPAAAPEAPVEQIGRYVSTDEVLLITNEQSSQWERMQANHLLYPGDQLLALPTYSPSLALSGGGGVNVHLLGGTLVEMEAPVDEIPSLHLEYGRIRLLTAGNAKARVRLRLGDRVGIAEFANPQATLGVEVRPFGVEGADPEAKPGGRVVELLVAEGEIVWIDMTNNQTERLTGPTRKVLGGSPEGAQSTDAKDLPAWLFNDELSNAQMLTKGDFEEELPTEVAVDLRLKELAEDRRWDIHALAARSLTYLGVYEPVLEALRNELQRNAWPDEVLRLREIVAVGPEEAKELRAAIDRRYGASAAAYYRMLWGYTADQLSAGEGRTIIESLDHQDPGVRVLAFWNFETLSGKRVDYRQVFDARKRKQMVQTWLQRYEDDELFRAGGGEAPTTSPAVARPDEQPDSNPAKP